jgi:diguanylate cyclase (GGDEF)-like protein/PAS domain S-box-containing protein
MKTRYARLRRLSLAALSLLILSPALWAAQTLTLGIFAFRPKPVMMEKYQALALYLDGALPDHAVRLEILTQAEMETALNANRLDFVFTNPSHFTLLRHHNRLSGAMATLVALEDGLPTAALGGVILAPAGRTDITRLEDLRGKHIAIPGMRFLGGYQAQAYELLLAGIDLPGDVRLTEAGSHDQVIETLLAGRADAGFVRTGIVEALTREGKLPADRLKVINPQDLPGFPYTVSTRLYPEWAFAALPHVPEEVVRRIARALLFIEPDMPPAQDADISGFTIPGDYQSVESLARALRLPPYETAQFHAADVWQRYRGFILAGLVAGGIILLLAARLAAGNRRLQREQEKLAASENRLKLTVDGANLGTWDWHIPDGKVHFNARWARMLGYAPEEIAASVDTWKELVHPADWALIHATLDPHLAGLTPGYTSEHRLQHKDGHWVWVLDSGQVIERDTAGKPLRATGIHLDITPAKQAEAALRQREQHLQTLLISMDEVVLVIDTAGNIGECHWPVNDAAAPDTTHWPGTECTAILPASIASVMGELMGELILAPDTPLRREFDWPLAGETRWFAATFSALKAPGDAYPRGFLCVAHDITAQKNEAIALALSHAEIERLSRRNQLLLDAAGEGIYGIDQQGRINFINPSALAMLGLTEAEALGRDSHALFHDRRLNGEPYPQAECPMHQTLVDGQRREVEEVFMRRNGDPFFVHLVTTPVIDAGVQVGAEVVFLDISARKAMEAELTRLATTDTLTGLANRRQFLAQAGIELARIRRFAQPTALLMLDLDFFKRVNDQHGHAAGDAVLQACAAILQGALRQVDVAGRLGGEEFAVLLPGSGLAEAGKFAERVRALIAAHGVPFGGQEIRLTVSIGIAALTADDTSPDTALARADAALYRAKAAGRNRVEMGAAEGGST